jgi:membrane associated rhomboid family serine protease
MKQFALAAPGGGRDSGRRLPRTVMGIYDRDYYRREGPSFLGSFVEKGTICKWLIGINVVLFFIQFVTRTRLPNSEMWEPVTDFLRVRAEDVLQGEIWRLLTYSFLHGSLIHLFFNMLFLWWFGNEIEDLLGPREFLCFYLLSALLGGVVFVLTTLLYPFMSCIGASGAVMAIMVLFACHYPRRTILLFFVIPVPIWVLVAFAVAKDLLGFLGGGAGAVAVQVHLAGAAFAFAYFKFQFRLTGWLPSWQRWKRRQQSSRLRVYQPEEETRPTPVPVPVPSNAITSFEEEQLEAKMDAVLEKISRVGKENLTESERQVLLRASEIYRRRHH